MWARTYLLLLIVRFYFALSPSYIHPDENFQGPEVIAGKLLIIPRMGVLSISLTQTASHGAHNSLVDVHA
jgi:hypothetical protein